MMMASSQPQAVSLARVLGSLEEEVSSLARMSDEIQDVLSDVLGTATMTNADLLSVQNLDLIAQHLGAIATYVKELSSQVSDEWAVRPELAASVINLSGLAHRLSLRPPEEAVDDSEDPFLF
jgi:phosphate uptake regulator